MSLVELCKNVITELQELNRRLLVKRNLKYMGEQRSAVESEAGDSEKRPALLTRVSDLLNGGAFKRSTMSWISDIVAVDSGASRKG
jgi:hypothetical protein